MAGNKKLHIAKEKRNSEYYTEYSTISNEISKIRNLFRGKSVYCNCDDPSWSNFWRYFHNNFASLGLTRLVSTHYQHGSEPSYALIYEGGDDFNMECGKVVTIYGNDDYTAGDFRSNECLKYLDECDITITNPPFDLFREYMAVLIEHGKDFLVLGNQNAVTYKEIFPLIKENKVWYGESIHSGGVDFRIPDDYDSYSKNVFMKNGHHYVNLAGIRWFTNLDVPHRHDGLWHINGKFDKTQAHCYYEENEEKYPKYDNYDAINVNKTKEIPIDYEGIMGVPITFLDKFNPDEFEILGITDRQNTSGLRTKKYTKNDSPKYNDLNARSVLKLENGTYKQVYARLLIRNRHPIPKSEDKGY